MGESRVKLYLMLLLMLIAVSSASAIEFKNEEVYQGVTDFRWCFDNPWQEDMAFTPQNFRIFQDNINCEGLEGRLYVERTTPVTTEKCTYSNECVTTGEYANKTPIQDCYQKETCVEVLEYATTYIDVEEEDVLLPRYDRLCYFGKREAKTGEQSCDMNFEYDDGMAEHELLTTDYGKLWFNSSFLLKKQIFPICYDDNCTNTPLTFWLFNDSDINSSTHDFDDVWIIDENLNAELPIQYVNSTKAGLVFLFNSSDNSTSDYYVYYNSTFSGTNTSIFDPDTEHPHNGIRSHTWDTAYTDSYKCAGGDCAEFGINQTNYRSYQNSIYMSNANGDRVATQDAGYTRAGEFKIWFREHNQTVANEEWHIILESGGSQRFVCGVREAESGARYLFYDGTYKFGGIVNRQPDTWLMCDIVVNSTGVTSWVHDGLEGRSAGNKLIDNDATIKTTNYVWYYGANANNVVFDDFYQSNFPNYTFSMQQTPPTYTTGAESSEVPETDLVIGAYDEGFVNHSLTFDEGEEFYIWANWTWDANNTVINDTIGTCRYSANRTLQERYSENAGTDITVCAAGCDSTNYTWGTFTNFNTTGFVEDIYRLRLCHENSIASDFSIHTNCSESHAFSGATIPLCSVGYVNFSVVSANCSGATQINLSVWSDGNNINQALRITDTFGGIDRMLNDTNVGMTFNDTLQVWHTPEVREAYENGFLNVTVNCTGGVIENETEVLSLTIQNIDPVNTISSVWWWLLSAPQAFVDDTDAKYPLEETLNITGTCTDNDLASYNVYVNYTNGTNIYTQTGTIGSGSYGVSVNLTDTNFSTNFTFLDGTNTYEYIQNCTDAQGATVESSVTFSAENFRPTVSWTNTSPISISGRPRTFNFTCTDDESEISSGYVYLDGLLNISGLGLRGVVFNESEGDYTYNASCADSFRNSTNDTLEVSYSESCMLNLTGLEAGRRYRSLEHQIEMNCTNGATINTCHHSINEFADEVELNCSVFNITLERGWNRFNVTIDRGLVTQTGESFSVFGFSETGGFWDYPLMLYLTAVCLLLFLGSMYFRSPVGFAIFMIAGLRLSYEFFTLSMVLGAVVAGLVLLLGFAGMLQKKE